MIRTSLVVSAILLAPWLTVAGHAESADDIMNRRVDKARNAVLQLSDRLKRDLLTELKAGGAANAIGACESISPDAATSIADESGFEVSRVSAKPRNPENTPDQWEEKVLRAFQAQLGKGTDFAKLEHYEEVVSQEGDKLFRYMKAIPVEPMCLACHGTDIKADVKAEITRNYPNDKAVGYKLGELRGAFSLVQLIGE